MTGSCPNTGGLGGLYVLMLISPVVAVGRKYRKKN
jgi:hypothetical protein